ncbi:reverse transcriptase domain-containing protein [Tanacetum coccineum]
MSIRLANHTYQYPVRVAENMPVQVGKFIFPVDFLILELEEDSRVPLILGRLFLHIADALICVKNKELNLEVRDDRIAFLIDKAMKHSYSNDDTCFLMDVIDEGRQEEVEYGDYVLVRNVRWRLCAGPLNCLGKTKILVRIGIGYCTLSFLSIDWDPSLVLVSSYTVVEVQSYDIAQFWELSLNFDSKATT